MSSKADLKFPADPLFCDATSQRVERRLAHIGGLCSVKSMSVTGESKPSIKKAAAQLVSQLPESASWDDLMYEILVRQKIEAGLGDLHDGRAHSHASIREEFGMA